MKVYWKYYIIPLLYGIIFSWEVNIIGSEKADICSMVAYLGNGNIVECSYGSVLDMLSVNFIYFMFIIVFSTYIYRHFCNSSVYIFSRCNNRIIWYIKECLKLLGFVVLGNIMVLTGFTITAVLGCGITFSQGSMLLVGLYLLVYSLWIFASVLLANILSIKINSAIGNVITMGLLLFSTILLGSINYQNITSEDILKLRLNPMSYSILSWYKVKINGEIWSGEIEYACGPWIGVAFLGGCCLAVLVAGAIFIQRMDITKNSTEN